MHAELRHSLAGKSTQNLANHRNRSASPPPDPAQTVLLDDFLADANSGHNTVLPDLRKRSRRSESLARSSASRRRAEFVNGIAGICAG
jgi:hypothetical protein